jgi:serine/threonine protein kinase/Tol biopolymer transport system component
MTLAAGTRLGAYEITGELGVGGMGEVYRARDTKLGRDVAIKTLPSAFAKDPDRLARFEREAKLLAAVNHAHIAAIYSLDELEGTQYLAMELVEGQTLEQKLKAGPLPLDETLHLALQIAEALEAAHEKSVVHRDLKPANIMVTRDGVAKVLDFGLAKAFSGDPNQANPAHSPALSVAMTQQGLILGTAGYMSPEQASGQATDQRADIWAFGVVLYEMLTGIPPFAGESVPHILADVLRTEPDWSRLPRNLHPRLKLSLERCLKKKVRDRYHSIADARADIEDVLRDPEGAMPAVAGRPPATRRLLPLAAACLVGAVIAGLAVWTLGRRAPTPAESQRVSLTVPGNRPVDFYNFPGRPFAISPDGTQIVYVAENLDAPVDQRRNQLELRSLGALTVRDLPGTTGARQPFFSPDGQWIGFFTETGELKKLSLAGGVPITLAQNINGSSWSFGVWTEDGTIVFGTVTSGLRRISAEGGEVTDLTTLDAAQHEQYHLYPALVPQRRAVLFTVVHSDNDRHVEAMLPSSGERHVVIENASQPLVLSGGRLVFQRSGTILVAPFDTKSLTVTGVAVPLIDEVQMDAVGTAQLAVSKGGTLAYLPAANTATELGLVGRDGSFERLDLPPGRYGWPSVSPDGRTVAFLDGESRIELHDLERGTTTKLWEGRARVDSQVAWRPDGRSLAAASRSEPPGIRLLTLDGTEQPLVPQPPDVTLFRTGSWSPDGMELAYSAQTGGRADIWILTMGEKPTTAPFIVSAVGKYSPKFSPDGRWLAFEAFESGRYEVYVQRFPKGERLAVSTDGGRGPVWRPDGKELFFQGSAGGVEKLMAVSVTAEGNGLRLGEPAALFDLRAPDATGTIERYQQSNNVGAGYDVLPDGKRFVMARNADSSRRREIVLVQHWFEELDRLVPTK